MIIITAYNNTEDIIQALKEGQVRGMMMDNLRALYFAPLIKAEQLFAIQFYQHPSMHGILATNLSAEITSCLVEKSEIMQYRILEQMSRKTAPIGVSF